MGRLPMPSIRRNSLFRRALPKPSHWRWSPRQRPIDWSCSWPVRTNLGKCRLPKSMHCKRAMPGSLRQRLLQPPMKTPANRLRVSARRSGSGGLCRNWFAIAKSGGTCCSPAWRYKSWRLRTLVHAGNHRQGGGPSHAKHARGHRAGHGPVHRLQQADGMGASIPGASHGKPG